MCQLHFYTKTTATQLHVLSHYDMYCFYLNLVFQNIYIVWYVRYRYVYTLIIIWTSTITNETKQTKPEEDHNNNNRITDCWQTLKVTQVLTWGNTAHKGNIKGCVCISIIRWTLLTFCQPQAYQYTMRSNTFLSQ